MIISLCLAFFALPYWEAKPPAEWSDEQLRAFLRSSPWAQVDRINARGLDEGLPDRDSLDPANAHTAGVQVRLASAAPVVEAEQEWSRRHPPSSTAAEDQYGSEFYEFLAANRGKYIALAVRLARPRRLEIDKEVAQMEKHCELRINKRRYKLAAHFLPSPADPYLRLLFPRELAPGDQLLEFSLYLPGVTFPHRKIAFEIKNLYFKGHLEL
jgi:hypothetical protein